MNDMTGTIRGVYSEPGASRLWWYWAIAAFAVLYLACLGYQELEPSEALMAVTARELVAEGNFTTPTIQGRTVNIFPLYAWLDSVMVQFRLLSAGALRFPAALAVAGLMAACGWLAGRTAGRRAGAVAALAAGSSLAVIRYGASASGDTWFALLLTLAWFSWYRLGRIGRRWPLAWTVSLALVALATTAQGALALLFFYLPLFFLGGRMRVWKRMLIPAHFLALAVLATGIIAWMLASPQPAFLPWHASNFDILSRAGYGLLLDYLLFPVKCVLYFLPWSLLAWPAFCAAFQRVECAPILFRFLRTVIVSLFLTAWILPRVAPHTLLPLVGPLAVLTGLHYDILMRRHHKPLHRALRAGARAAAAAAAAILVLAGLHAVGVVVLHDLTARDWWRIVILGSVGLAALLWITRSRHPYWAKLTLLVLGVRLLFAASWGVMHKHFTPSKRLMAAKLVREVPYGATVYKMPATPLLLRTTFYMNRPVRQLDSPDELPEQSALVYVLDGSQPPIHQERGWTACSPLVGIPARRIAHWTWLPGGHCLLEIKAAAVFPLEQDIGIVRMYRGALRPGPEEVGRETADASLPSQGSP